MENAIDTLLSAAGRAPSGDNMQPWRFLVDADARRIVLQLDESRDRSPMNAGQRMSRIAVGAALENLLRAAQAHGGTTDLEPAPRDGLAAVHVSGQIRPDAAIDTLIAARVTNRRLYDGRSLAAGQQDQLAARTPVLEGVVTHWIVAREQVARLAQVIASADAVMFGHRAVRRAFLANIRFDAPPESPVSEGLSLGSLELSRADRVALRLMRRAPAWLVEAGGAPRVFATKARQLVQSASGLCLIAAPNAAAHTDLLVGRAMQRAWLELTALGLAVQPMMSLPVLENAREHGDSRLVAELKPERINALGDHFRSFVPELERGRVAALLRFGFAPAPSGRTGRLPIDTITTKLMRAESAQGLGAQDARP